MTRRHPPHIVIVGGGLAGLSAAEALASLPCRGDVDADHPFRITLLEARSATGGRAGSFLDPVSGESVDYCQHVTMGCCTNLLALLKRVGLQDAWTRYPELTFWHRDTGQVPFRPNRRLPAPLHLQSALSRLRFLSKSERRRIRQAVIRLMRTPESALAGEVAKSWLERHGQGPAVRRLFWDVILISALGDLPERVSMAAARKVMIDGFAAARGASDVLVPNRPLSELFGVRLQEHLSSMGVTILTRAAVKSIRRGSCSQQTLVRRPVPQPTLFRPTPSDSEAGWELHLQSGGTETSATRDAKAEPIRADHVILALPWHAAGRLIRQSSGLETLSVPKLNSSPISGLHLWFDRPLTPLPHVVLTGTLAQWLFCDPLRGPEASDVPASRNGEVYHQVVISGRHRLSDATKDQLVTAVLDELRAAFPDASSANLIRSRVVTDPHSVFSVSPEAERERPTATTQIPTISLAGDWVQTGWPATMEGAVISGRLAANAVCRYWKMPQQIHLETPLRRSLLTRLLDASPSNVGK